MSVDTRFTTFLNNIKPTDIQLEDARTKYDGVCKKLHDYYYSYEYTGSTKLLIGSYGKHTNIRPPRDVDILFIMPYEEFDRYDSYEGNGQSQLLQDIKKILQEKYSTTDSIRGDGQVIVIPFESGHKVELLLAWLLENGKYYIPNTHEGGSWKIVDPKAEIKQIQDFDKRSNGNIRNLVRMLKVWQRACNVPIKSLVIELRVVNFLKKYKYFDKSTIYYDWIVRDFLKELLKYVSGNCKMPGINEKIYYGDEWESKAKSAYIRAKKACEYEKDEDEYNATVEWKKIFGGDFQF